MARVAKELRRVAGFLAARLVDLKLKRLEDPRTRRGRRWSLEVIVRTVVVGLCAGCQSVAEIEDLTERMSGPMRRKLGIRRRLPDTTLRDVLVRLHPYDVRQALRQSIYASWRRGALAPDDLPFGVLALDGKFTSLPVWDHHYSQMRTHDEGKKADGLVGTVTACLISTPAKPIIEAFPMTAATNEMGFFPHVIESLVHNYNGLFQLVTYDAGVPSADNCQYVVDVGKDFFFRVKNENWHVYKEAGRLLGNKPVEEALDMTEDVLSNKKSVFRAVFAVKAPQVSWVWKPIKSLIRVNVRTVENGVRTHEENKYYISSLAPDRLTGAQWLRISRGHWNVENNGHWTLDAIFREDERPWIPTDPRGTVVVMLLRRIAYTMMALFRGVTLRSEGKRITPWKKLMAWVHDTLIAITAEQLDELRPRKELPAFP